MLRLFVIIAFIYLLYLFIRFAIRRSLVMNHSAFRQRQNFRSTSREPRSAQRPSRFDGIEEAEYEELYEDPKKTGNSSS